MRFKGADGWHALEVRRHPRARAARLRIDPHRRTPVLTLPLRASLAKAASWAERQREWIETRLARLPEARPLAPGACFPYRGQETRIVHDPGLLRRPRLEGGVLRVGGPAEALPARIERWLRNRAREILEAESKALAARAGLTLAGISIGDARTRWGSCSSTGRIRYNWRLVMAPPRVLSATVAHEIAHLRHMNHGPEFHAFVEWLFGDPSAERAWLRDEGRSLYCVGRRSGVTIAG